MFCWPFYDFIDKTAQRWKERDGGVKGQQVGDEPWALLILMIKKKLNISSDNRLPTVYSKYIHVSICSIYFYLYF